MQSYHRVHVQLGRKDSRQLAAMLAKGRESARVLRRASILREPGSAQKAAQVAANVCVAAKMVTGGTLVPPTIPTDIYPNPDPNATIRSASGIKGGIETHLAVGDVIINPPGTPHWITQIDGTIEYVEIHRPNVDPAPGVERAVVAK